MYIAISYPFSSTLISLFFTFGNFDFVYVSMTYFEINSGLSSFLLTYGRHIIYMVQIQWMLLNAKAAIFVTLGIHIGNVKIFKLMHNSKIIKSSDLSTQIIVYKKVSIMLLMLSSMVNTVMGSGMAMEFLITLLGATVFVLGFGSLPNSILATLFVGTFSSFGGALLMFEIGCYYHTTSRKILVRWKKHARKLHASRRLELEKTVWSCREISVKPAGISVVTVRLMEGYFDALLQNTLTVILLLKKSWAHS